MLCCSQREKAVKGRAVKPDTGKWQKYCYSTECKQQRNTSQKIPTPQPWVSAQPYFWLLCQGRRKESRLLGLWVRGTRKNAPRSWRKGMVRRPEWASARNVTSTRQWFEPRTLKNLWINSLTFNSHSTKKQFTSKPLKHCMDKLVNDQEMLHLYYLLHSCGNQALV